MAPSQRSTLYLRLGVLRVQASPCASELASSGLKVLLALQVMPILGGLILKTEIRSRIRALLQEYLIQAETVD